MGGPGSGNWYHPDRRTSVEETQQIDIRNMRKRGLLYAGCAGSFSWSVRDQQTGSVSFRVEWDQLVLMYRHQSKGKEWQDIEERIWFDRTPCNYGGERLWFLCPHCGKRVAVLCGAVGRFLCRHCHDLSYGSQNEVFLNRMMRKARKIRRHLGASESLDEPIWQKPKGMHQTTFERLVKEESEASRAIAPMIGEQMEMLRQQLAAHS